MTTATAPTVKAPRGYNSWLVELIAVGQVYGVKSARWNETLSAAYKDLLFRVWSLADEAEAAIKAVK
jgi:hypothetical protein